MIGMLLYTPSKYNEIPHKLSH